uniref:Uncharacterized protein n=1 Tax=Arundo donax TaxID=35708 RepID=A0A0A8Y8C6_ARUDO
MLSFCFLLLDSGWSFVLILQYALLTTAFSFN